MYKITNITEQKRNKKRRNIFVNEEYFGSASEYILGKFKLEIGTEVDKEKLKQLILEDSYEKAKEYVVKYLLGKTFSIVETKLKEKGYEEETIERVIEFLKNYRLMDDKDYAKRMTHDGLFIKRQGKKMIQMKLKQKGVGEEEIREVLGEINKEDEVNMAIKALVSKIEGYKRKSKNHYQLKQKCYTYLFGRGFDYEIIEQAVNQVIKDQD